MLVTNISPDPLAHRCETKKQKLFLLVFPETDLGKQLYDDPSLSIDNTSIRQTEGQIFTC